MRTVRDLLYYIEYEAGIDLDRPLMLSNEGYGIDITCVYEAKYDKKYWRTFTARGVRRY